MYKYAVVEYGRECWCGNSLNGMSSFALLFVLRLMLICAKLVVITVQIRHRVGTSRTVSVALRVRGMGVSFAWGEGGGRGGRGGNLNLYILM